MNTSQIIAAIPQNLIDAAVVELSLPRQSRQRILNPDTSEGAPRYINVPIEGETHTGKIIDESVVLNAYNAIAPATLSTSLGNHKQTYVSLAGDIGADMVNQLENGLSQAVASGAVRPWVTEALETEGLNVNDTGVAAALDGLVDNFGIDQPLVSAILETGYTDAPVFPGLKVGHVQTALVQRFNGEI